MRRLPHHRVAHQRRRGREVAADGREVERRHGEDEPFEGPVLHPVPDPRMRPRLLRVDLPHEVGVEAPEVDQLAGGIDLGLEDRLALVEHGRRVGGVAPGPGEQVGGPQQHRGPLLPTRRAPLVPGLPGGLGRRLDLRSAGLVEGGEHVLVVVRADGLADVARAHLLASNDERDLDLLGRHLVQSLLEGLLLRRARSIRPHRLVGRHGEG